MIKQQLSFVLRKLHLAKTADTFRFYYMVLKNLEKNNKFKKEYPNVILPPNYLMYESFQLDYYKYYEGGKEDAQWVLDTVKPYVNISQSNILDWGCGPGRILRHLPQILGPDNAYYGSDYNLKTILWCQKNIPGISFVHNNIVPPLNFPDNYFTIIYGISVLTHLSRENQSLWSKELNRIISPEGIVYLTTHGEAFIEKLTSKEIKSFTKDDLVSRENVIEGHRMYGAFHPPKYIKSVFEDSGFEVKNHVPGKRVSESYISQDKWLLRKNPN